MRYIIKTVYTCPEGAVTHIEYSIANSEDQMKEIVFGKKYSYSSSTCLGPVTEQEAAE